MTNIAFVGNMRHGKTLAATHLVTKYGYEKRAFADKVKDMSCVLLEAMGEFLVNNGNDQGEYTLDMTRARLESYKTHPAVRRFMQVVGGELGRDFYGPKDLWVQMFLHNLPTSAPIVIDDCRYKNEFEALKERDFVFVRVVRNKDEWYKDIDETYSGKSQADLFTMLSHPSETEFLDFEIDWTLNEAKTATDLYRQIDELMGNILAE